MKSTLKFSKDLDIPVLLLGFKKKIGSYWVLNNLLGVLLDPRYDIISYSRISVHTLEI